MQADTMTERVRRAGRFMVPVAAGGVLLAVPAWLVAAPFIAPPLGASVYVCFRARGMPAAAPRRVAVSHFAAIACALLARFLFDVNAIGMAACQQSASAMGAGVLAMALTTGALELLDAMHPPAVATTLVVALGIVSGTEPLAALAGGGLLLATAVAVFDRVAKR
jgi:CBS domain-containing membrane protein